MVDEVQEFVSLLDNAPNKVVGFIIQKRTICLKMKYVKIFFINTNILALDRILYIKVFS